jgi:hypothetical protein
LADKALRGECYLKGNFFLMGSVLYQLSNGMTPAANVATSIPKLTAKAGGEKGMELSVFDSYQGHIGGHGASINPGPDAFRSLDGIWRKAE